ncbi:MAG: Glutamate 5-kinase [Planctomycetes bacterium ADurb.Bin126]|nr:MAG: Glutamate 5-kinase [Planctomycetes bacterium ADurb.Bin126]HOD82899.1 glutamate 5-kinase [Phycisphaerae bacterium]HQL73751.1 glutamate 5-kinase [Phycisphaerae bacterium]
MPDRYVREQVIPQARRIVVKVGTNSLTDEHGRLDHAIIARLADQIARLMARGLSLTLVASGAIGAGMAELDLPGRPKTMPLLQATAAVGQGQLMRVFHDAFARHGVKVAQVLVTRDDFEDRTRYLNIRNTLQALEEVGALPILNENDAVAVDEIRFGDNDMISAHVTNLLAANLLVLLTNVDGVLKDGKLMDVIEQVDESALALATAQRSKLGSGGMGSKISAAALVVRAGEVAVIAKAREHDVLIRLLDGQRLGTVFVPAHRKMSSRRRWIGQASRPAGKVMVDEGAAKAIAQGGKSLLPSGVVAIHGSFPKGATVSILNLAGRQIARGLTNYSSQQLDRIKGLRTSQIAKVLGDKPYDEVVHRNNMTLV